MGPHVWPDLWVKVNSPNITAFLWLKSAWTHQPSATNKHVRLTTSQGSFCQWRTFILSVGVFLSWGCSPQPQAGWLHPGLLHGWGDESDGAFMPGVETGGRGTLPPGGRGGGGGSCGSRAGMTDCSWEEEEMPFWEGDVLPGECSDFLERLRSAPGFFSSKSMLTWVHLFTFGTDLLGTVLGWCEPCMLDSRLSMVWPGPIFLLYKTTRRCMD